MKWYLSHLFQQGLLNLFHNFHLLTEMVIKLLFQIQYSRLTQVFCFFLIILYCFICVLQLLYISRNIKVGRFSSRMKYLYGKYCLGYAGIPPWTSEIPPSLNGIKSARALYKRNKKLWRNDCSLLISFIVPPRLSYKQPLSNIVNFSSELLKYFSLTDRLYFTAKFFVTSISDNIHF